MSDLRSIPWSARLSGVGRTTTLREDLAIAVLGTWLVIGVFLDGWAHVNRTALETFFTPWHAVLYSGAGLSFGTVLLVVRRHGGVPPGYTGAVLGAPLFLVAGAGDFGWHSLFGLEVGLDALLSPTHLVLLASGLMLLLTPWWSDLRRASADDGAAGWPAVLSLALATSLGAFFLLYTSALTTGYAAQALTRVPEGAPGHEAAELPAAAGLSAYLVTTALLLVPLLLLVRRRAVPLGSATVLLVQVATLSGAVVQFRQPLLPVAALGAGLVLDAALVRTTGWRERLRTPALAALLPAALWPLQLLALAVTDGVLWPVELWAGVVLLTTGVAALLGWLSLGQAAPASPPSAAQPARATAAKVRP